MKAVMIGLALFLVMGCGRSDAKKQSEELEARNKAWKAEVEALSNARPNEPTKTGVKLWEFETGGTVHSSPSVGSDGTVYLGSTDTKLYAINGKTGDKLWEFETESSVVSSPAIGSDDTVYVGSNDEKLYAINPKTGAKLWEFETGADVRSSPAIGPDGAVYVGSDDKKIYAIKTDSTGPAKSPWPMFGQNAQRTGRAPNKE